MLCLSVLRRCVWGRVFGGGVRWGVGRFFFGGEERRHLPKF